MICGKSVLAVVPARGGSKGLPGKNLKTVGGHSIVERAVGVALQCPEIDSCILSTDSEEIARRVERIGHFEKYRRPTELAGDLISDIQVLSDAVKYFESQMGENVGYVVMLQPTSPLRKVSDISSALQMIEDGDYDSVWSVSEVDLKYHPEKQLFESNGYLEFYSPQGASVIARQQLSTTLIRNGVVYVLERDLLMLEKRLMGAKCGLLKIGRPVVSIDDLEDLMLTRRLFQKFKD